MVVAPNCTCPFIALPITPNNPSICFGTATPNLSVTLPETPALGDAVNWYDSSVGGTALGTGLSYNSGNTAVGIYTYYAEAEEIISGCVSDRILVVLTITALRLLTSLTNNRYICAMA